MERRSAFGATYNHHAMSCIPLRILHLARLFTAIAWIWPAALGASSLPQVAETKAEPPLVQAHLLINKGQFTAAESVLREILKGAPSSADAAYLLAYDLFRERKLIDSLSAYTTAAELRQPNAADLSAVASVYVLLKDYPDAEHWLLQAVRLAPEKAETWYLLGRTQFNQDHAALAAASFQHALELRPRDPKFEYNLGLAYEALQREEDARAAYRTAIEWQRAANLRDPQPFLDLGILLLRQQHPEEAFAPLRDAAEQGPNNPLAQQEFGLVLEALGHYTEALAPLQRAVRLAPEAEQPHFFLGRIYQHLGRKTEADAQYAIVARMSGARSGTPTPNHDGSSRTVAHGSALPD